MMQIQAQIKRKWSSGKAYDAYVKDELNSFRGQAWRELILAHIPDDKKLSVLDIGCGPGFFGCILSAEGHAVVGIDQSEAMLEHARANTRNRGLSCDFRLMDAHELQFEDASFDVVICRNVTWTLYDPARAYAEWLRVLKPGGLLLVFDANWHFEFYDESVRQHVRDNERRCREEFGRDMVVCEPDKELYDALPLSNTLRPEWDVEALHRVGFDQVDVTDDVGAKVYEPWEKVLYQASPLFEIAARKPTLQETKKAVNEYWDKRAATFGLDTQALGCWQEAISGALGSTAHLRVLDVGCGTGAMAIAAALCGCTVTGVDASAEMLAHAKENAREAGLDITFVQANAEKLPFMDGSFDIVINRNVVWNLIEPQRTFAEWHRVLAPEGRLLYFDAAWYRYLYDEKSRELWRRHYVHERPASWERMEAIANTLSLSDKQRPEWDKQLLGAAGFAHVRAEDVTSRVRTPEEQHRFAFAPQFMVLAHKTASRACAKREHPGIASCKEERLAYA